ncbi:MAG: hypothetical protein HYV27_16520 [Candidatus Hydrogenedentes bacterium]|nr:hypothetical protein [Candidatus Hydrogenedentota bacterium]
MTVRILQRLVLCGICCALFSSCATMGGWFGGGGPQTESGLPDSIAVGAADDRVAQLESLVKKHVDIVARRKEADQDKVIHRSPYYYKEYSVYDVDWSALEPEIRKTESRTAPYVADVVLPKQRFATKMTRDRQEALGDTRFQRDTGKETLTYELRNGSWVRVGSLFLAEKSEENRNGEWVAVQMAPVEEMNTEKDERGFFGRVWGGITGN